MTVKGSGEQMPACSAGGVPLCVRTLKKAPKGGIVTFGSSVLVQTLTNAGLVDEYRILVHPVIVSEGRHLFQNLTGRTDLQLVGSETFAGGAMLVTYAPKRL
ncbi:dihydrofolate reductase family protein [Nonomuraea sp. NPDC049725]|uniref:dihydrofolate reductase family protein n=1 Tax=Nonomuraea sp. NPDC049725 TaxID=3154508 RepID=UPI003432F6BB